MSTLQTGGEIVTKKEQAAWNKLLVILDYLLLFSVPPNFKDKLCQDFDELKEIITSAKGEGK